MFTSLFEHLATLMEATLMEEAILVPLDEFLIFSLHVPTFGFHKYF